MPLDLKDFYEQNRNYYGDVSLDKVAQQLYEGEGGSKTGLNYEDWTKDGGIKNQIEEDKYQRESQKARQDTPGILGEFGRSIGRGVTQTLPEQIGKGLQWLDPDGGNEVVSNVGKSLEQLGADNQKRLPGLTMSAEAENASNWNPRKWVAHGGESLVSSVAPMAVGMAAGAVGGPVAGLLGLGATAAGAVGKVVGAATGLAALGEMFYGGTAEDTYREGIKKGLSPQDAKDLANITGGVEAGGELIQDLIPIPFFKGLGKGAIGKIIRDSTSRMPAKVMLGNVLKTIAGEELTESSQQAAQTYAAQRYGVADQSIMDSVQEVWGPTFITSLIFGAGGIGYNTAHRSNIRKALTDPSVDPNTRLSAINEVAQAARDSNKEVGDNFYAQAVDLWRQAKPITIDDDQFYAPATSTNTTTPPPPGGSGIAGGDVGTNAINIGDLSGPGMGIGGTTTITPSGGASGIQGLVDSRRDILDQDARMKSANLEDRGQRGFTPPTGPITAALGTVTNTIIPEQTFIPIGPPSTAEQSARVLAEQKTPTIDSAGVFQDAINRGEIDAPYMPGIDDGQGLDTEIKPKDITGLSLEDLHKARPSFESRNRPDITAMIDAEIANKTNKIPEYLRPIFEIMSGEINAGGIESARDIGEGGKAEHIGRASTHAQWVRDLSSELDGGFGIQDFNTVVSKKMNNQPLTDPQSVVWKALETKADEYNKQHPDTIITLDEAAMRKQGFEPYRDPVPVKEMQYGDRLLIKGEEFELTGHDMDGNYIMQDGVPIAVHPDGVITGIEGVAYSDKVKKPIIYGSAAESNTEDAKMQAADQESRGSRGQEQTITNAVINAPMGSQEQTVDAVDSITNPPISVAAPATTAPVSAPVEQALQETEKQIAGDASGMKAGLQTSETGVPQVEEPASTQDLTNKDIAKQVKDYQGTGGITTEARKNKFMSAFRDNETGKIYPVPGIHDLNQLPDELVTQRHPVDNEVEAVKGSVEAGFVKDGQFFTRAEAVISQQNGVELSVPKTETKSIVPESTPTNIVSDPLTAKDIVTDGTQIGEVFEGVGKKLRVRTEDGKTVPLTEVWQREADNRLKDGVIPDGESKETETLLTAEEAKSIEEKIYSEQPVPVRKSQQGNLAAMAAYDKAKSEWNARYREAVKNTEQAQLRDNTPDASDVSAPSGVTSAPTLTAEEQHKQKGIDWVHKNIDTFDISKTDPNTENLPGVKSIKAQRMAEKASNKISDLKKSGQYDIMSGGRIRGKTQNAQFWEAVREEAKKIGDQLYGEYNSQPSDVPGAQTVTPPLEEATAAPNNTIEQLPTQAPNANTEAPNVIENQPAHLMPKTEYDKAFNDIIDAGDSVKPDHEAIKRHDTLLTFAKGKFEKIKNQVDNSSMPSLELRDRLDKAQTKYELLFAENQELHDGANANWDNRQAERTRVAKEKYQHLIDSGNIKEQPHKTGESWLTIEQHKDAVKKAVQSGQLSPSDYASLHEKDYGPIENFAPGVAAASEDVTMVQPPDRVGTIVSHGTDFGKFYKSDGTPMVRIENKPSVPWTKEWTDAGVEIGSEIGVRKVTRKDELLSGQFKAFVQNAKPSIGGIISVDAFGNSEYEAKENAIRYYKNEIANRVKLANQKAGKQTEAKAETQADDSNTNSTQTPISGQPKIITEQEATRIDNLPGAEEYKKRAFNGIDRQIKDANDNIADWQSREYKPNAGHVDVGSNEIEQGDTPWQPGEKKLNIGRLNEKRRAATIRAYNEEIKKLEESKAKINSINDSNAISNVYDLYVAITGYDNITDIGLKNFTSALIANFNAKENRGLTQKEYDASYTDGKPDPFKILMGFSDEQLQQPSASTTKASPNAPEGTQTTEPIQGQGAKTGKSPASSFPAKDIDLTSINDMSDRIQSIESQVDALEAIRNPTDFDAHHEKLKKLNARKDELWTRRALLIREEQNTSKNSVKTDVIRGVVSGHEQNFIGQNKKGVNLYQDEKGKRYKITGDVRINEPNPLTTSRGAVIGVRNDPGWQTVKELQSVDQNEDILEPIDEESKHVFNKDQFVKDVLETAQATKTGWFGEKVFINHVFDEFSKKHPEYGFDIDTFKKQLVNSDRSMLSRADLVSVMNQKDVSESESAYLGATFNFIHARPGDKLFNSDGKIQSRRETEANQNVTADKPQTKVEPEAPNDKHQTITNKANSLSLDELESMFDDVIEEKQAAAPSAEPSDTKTSAIAPPLSPSSTATVAQSGRDNKNTTVAATRSLGNILGDATFAGMKGVDESIKGLFELFGGSRLKSFPGGFDEDAYRKAKPHFQAMLESFELAGKNIKEFFTAIADKFGAGIKPYLMRFMQDLKGVVQETPITETDMEKSESVVTPENKPDTAEPVAETEFETKPETEPVTTTDVETGEAITVEDISGTKGEPTGRRKGRKQTDVGEKMWGKISANEHRARAERLDMDLTDDFFNKNPASVLRLVKNKTSKATIFTIAPVDGATPGVRRTLDHIRMKFQGFEQYYKQYGGNLATDIEDWQDRVKEMAAQYISALEVMRDTLNGHTTVEGVRDAFREMMNTTAGEKTDVHNEIIRMATSSGLQDVFSMMDGVWFTPYIDGQYEATKDLQIRRERVRLEDLDMPGDRRDGKDIKATALIDEFGLRGVEFGEWVDSVHGQLSVNYTWDAFHDMSEIIGATVKGISLNARTRLGLAFGSRGKSGAAAHFEPGNKVINLTKTNGDGSLAHEWAHAFDEMTGELPVIFKNHNGQTIDTRAVQDLKNALCTSYNLDGMTKDIEDLLRGGVGSGRKIKASERVSAAKEMLKGWVGKYSTRTEYFKNAIELDKGDINAYWSKENEMFARAFESFIADQLQGANPYLVNKEFVAPGGVEAMFNRSYGAYPTDAERSRFNGLFKDFFAGLEWSKDGIATIKEGYEPVTAKEIRLLNEIVAELESKLQDIFDSMFAGEKSEDGLYWYAYKDMQRGVRMQPDGYMGFNDEFNVKTLENSTGFAGKGAIGYGDKLSSSEVLDYGLTPITHTATDKTIYLEVKDVISARHSDDGEAALGGASTTDGEVSEKPGDIRGDTGGGGRQGEGRDLRSLGSGGSDTGRSSGNNDEAVDISAVGGRAEDFASEPMAVSSTKNDFILTSEDIPTKITADQHYLNAISAIRLLKQIESENRLATTEEQRILAKMPGWGTLAEPLASYPKAAWASRAEALVAELTDRELYSAQDATLTSYFTPIEALDFIYKAVQNMGFNGGRMLEPAVGLGHFIGAMPTSMRKASMFTAIEKDGFLVRFAKQLYQSASILHSSYENTSIPSGFFDFIATNVPFANFTPSDKEHNPLKFLLHDYYIIKSLNMLRPGGIGVMLTSSGTMDKATTTAREEMARVADFLGAVRLPSSAFNATQSSVTTDIMFFRKKSPDALKVTSPEWIKTISQKLKYSGGMDTKYNHIDMNQYFVDHPEMVLGELSIKSGRYGENYEIKVSGILADIGDRLEVVLKHLPQNIYHETGVMNTQDILDILAKPSDIKNGAFYIGEDGSVYKNNGGTPEKIEVKTLKSGDKSESDQRKVAVIKGFVGLRTNIREVLRAQAKEINPGDIKKLQAKLSKQYDLFVKKFGFLNKKENKRAFIADPDLGMVLGLEKWDADHGIATKQAIFTENLIERSIPPSHVDTSADAMMVSLNYRNRVDLPYMANLTGMTQEQIISELAGEIFNDPIKGWVTSDDYLSGNIHDKIKVAEQAAKSDSKFDANVKALQAVIPTPITHDKIYVQLGGAWIDPGYYVDFSNHILNVGHNIPGLIVSKSPLGAWDVSFHGGINNRTYNENMSKSLQRKQDAYARYEAHSRWGTDGNNGNYFSLLSNLLNGTSPEIRYASVDGKKGAVNREATDAAIMKMYEIKEAFNSWLWKDSYRRELLSTQYNNSMNAVVGRKPDTSHLPLPGKVPDAIVKLAGHQNAAIRRYLKDGNAYFAHDVGTGKTFTMIASIMESKRLGLAKRPVLLVMKSTLTQIQEQFYRLYPGANILTISVPDNAAARVRELQKIASGNWDCVIMTHESFKKIPISPEIESNFLDEERRRLTIALETMRSGKSSRKLIKQVSGRLQSLEARINDLSEKDHAKDPVPTFDELGIDMIVADEAHVYKNLPIETVKGNVRGLNITGSDMAFDMFMKSSYLQSTYHRGLIFASGTPVTNSVGELYSISRYLQPEALRESGLESFDIWANTFGDIGQATRYAPEGGGFQTITKFRSFVNLPELMQMVGQVMDIVKFEDTGMKRPPMEGGKPQAVVVPLGDLTSRLAESIKERAVEYRRDPKGVEPDNMLKIINDGRNAAMDPRLYDPSLPDVPETKTNYAVPIIMGIYNNAHDAVNPNGKAYKEKKGVQLIFCDRGVPGKGNKFSIYRDLKEKLIKSGIPEKEIAFIHDATSDQSKQQLFKRIQSGDIRVIIGSTEKLGTGVNVQDRVVAIHNLDIGWTFEGFEQRLGRGLRYGNRIKDVAVFNYGTEKTVDAFMWDTVAGKGKVINQVLVRDPVARSVDDIAMDEKTMSGDEMVAAFSNDPLVKEKKEIEDKISRMRAARGGFERRRAELQVELAKAPAKLESLNTRLKKSVSLSESLAPIDAIKMSGQESVFVLSKDGGKANAIADKTAVDIDAIKRAQAGVEAGTGQDTLRVIGHFGVSSEEQRQITVTDKDGNETVKTEKVINFKPSDARLIVFFQQGWNKNEILASLMVRAGSGEVTQYYGPVEAGVSRTLTTFKSKIDGQMSEIKANIEKIERETPEMKADIEKPFIHEKALSESEARLSVVNRELIDQQIRNEAEIAGRSNKTDISAKDDILFSDANVTKDKSGIGSVSTKQAENALQPMIDKVNAQGKIKIVLDASIEAIEDEATRTVITNYKNQGRVVKAYLDNQTHEIHLIVGNASSVDGLTKALIHELVGHHGLYEFMGDDLTPFLDFLNRHSKFSEQVKAEAKIRGINMSTKAGQDRAAKEWFAGIVERGEIEPSLWTQFVKYFKSALRNMGFNIEFTDSDIAEIIRGARKAAEGKGAEYGKSGLFGKPAFDLQDVYHGGPHVWSPEPGFPHGRPRLDKIGSGEGAAVYGWGWYSSETEAVGEQYKAALTEKPKVFLDGKPYDGDTYKAALPDIFRDAKDIKEVESQLRKDALDIKPQDEGYAKSINKLADMVASGRLTSDKQTRGALYKLDIPDAVIPKLLDWDKKLSEQSEYVRTRIEKALQESGLPNMAKNNPTGEQIYNSLSLAKGGMGKPDFKQKKAASEYLASIGIPGNKYQDGMTRKVSVKQNPQTGYWFVDGAGVATGFKTKEAAWKEAEKSISRNYVIWDQKVLDQVALLKRNGEKLDAIRDAESQIDYSMAGKKAETADMGMLKQAERMALAGNNRGAILKATGWWKGYEGSWKFEIIPENIQTTKTFETVFNDFKNKNTEKYLPAPLPKLEDIKPSRRLVVPGTVERSVIDEDWEIELHKTPEGGGFVQLVSNEGDVDIISRRALFADAKKVYDRQIESIINQNANQPSPKRIAVWEGSVSDLIKYDELFKAYPDLKDYQVIMRDKTANDTSGGYAAPGHIALLIYDKDVRTLKKFEPSTSNLENRNIANTLVHELQHIIQGKEDFARGIDPKYIALTDKNAKAVDDAGDKLIEFNREKSAWWESKEYAKIAKAMKKAFKTGDNAEFERLKKEANGPIDEITKREKAFKDDIKGKDGSYAKYMKTMGEAEARMVTIRTNMTPAQRKAEYPWVTMERMMRDEGLLKDDQKPEDVLVNRGAWNGMAQSIDSIKPWPKDFPNILPHSNQDKLSNHPLHEAAKAGDVEAAIQVVRDLFKPAKARELAKRFPNAVLVPARAVETLGRNKLPLELAEAISDSTGLEIDQNIFQINHVGHTESNRLQRLLSRAIFDGKVVNGQEYILVEDTAASGGTLHELRHYIENNGGKVVAVTTIAFGRGATVLAIKHETISKIERKFGRGQTESFLREYNIAGNIESLTEGEGRFLGSQPSLDTLRVKIVEGGYGGSTQNIKGQVQGSDLTQYDVDWFDKVRKFINETSIPQSSDPDVTTWGHSPANDTRIDFSDTIEAAPLTGTVLPQISRLTTWLESHGYKEKAEQLATYFWDQDASITARQKELGVLSESQDYDMKKRLMGKRIADEVELFNRDKVKPIQAEMAANGLKTVDVDELLHADHAPERNLQMKRINARRYLDAIIGNMTDAEAAPYQSMIYDIGDELDAAGLFNGDISVLNEKRDAYIGMLDALSLDVSSTADTEQQKIDALQDKLNNRVFTAEEIESGTQARKQKEIDNKQKRLDQRISIAKTWEDVKNRLSGMTNEKSKEIQDKWAGNAAIKSVADKLRKINSDAFDMMHDVGELTDEEYESMGSPYKLHVPLMREGFAEGKAATGMSGYGPLGKPVKLAAGSTRKVIDITANIIDRYQSEINRKHKLDASRALYEMVYSNPDENRWGIIKQKKVPRLDDEGNIRYFNENPRNLEDNEVFVKVDGQLYKIGVPFDNPSMMRWMEAIKRTPTELGPFLKSSQKIVRFLAGLNTSFSPEFLPSNFIRDLPVAMIHLESINGAEGAQKAVLKHIKAAIKGIYQSERGDNTSEMAKLFRDFAKHGGKVGWMQGYDSVAELAKNFEKELAFEEGKHPGMDKLKKLGKWITDMNTAVENGVRLSAYKVMIDGGMSKLKAATAASGLTIDFTQHGTAGPIINSLYMFANAGIQGNVRMIKALNTPKIRKIAAAIVGFGAMASIMGVMVGGDDDDGEPYYDKLKRTNPSLFERNMVFMVPGSKGKYFKIPMPYGYNAFFVLGNEIAGVIRGQSPIDSMSRICSVLMNVLNPLASATLLQTIMPTIGDPIAQVMENKSWAGGALMPEKSPFGIPTPDSERYFKSVNPALKSVAQWVNSVTGGNKYKPGLIDVSPETLEMVVETFTGSAGRLAKDALFLPTSAVTGDLEMNKVPFVRRVFGSTSEKINAGIYRENNDKVDILIKQIKDADVSERGELAKNPLSQMIAFHKNTESRMLKLNKMNKIAEKLGREENVKKNDEEMMRLKMQYNKRFNQLTLRQ